MSLLLAHLSDSHFDERGDVEDQVAVHRAFVTQVRDAGVHAIVHAGDLFERASTPHERLLLADFLRAAADVAPVFGVKGNHDRALDLDLFPMLGRTRHHVVLVDRPGLTMLDLPVEAGRTAAYPGRLGLLAIPWFDKAPVASGVDAAAGREASRIATQDQARALLLGMSAYAAEARAAGAVPVLVAHCMVGGSIVSTGQMLLGVTVEVSPADLLTTGAEYVALGHVHKHQEWAGGRVAYSGSPRRCNHGETEAKGWRLVRFEDGKFAGAEFMELPARRLIHVEVDWTDPDNVHYEGSVHLRPNWYAHQVFMEAAGDGLVAEARVRVRYKIAARDLALVDQDALRQRLLAAGAHDVQLEAVVVQESRARAPELVSGQRRACIHCGVDAEALGLVEMWQHCPEHEGGALQHEYEARTLTLADKVRAYLEGKGAPMDRWPEVEAKLAEIGG